MMKLAYGSFVFFGYGALSFFLQWETYIEEALKRIESGLPPRELQEASCLGSPPPGQGRDRRPYRGC